MPVVERIRDVPKVVGGLQRDIPELMDGDDLCAAGLTSHATVGLTLALEAFDIGFPDRLLSSRTLASVDAIAVGLEEIGAAEVVA